MAYVPGVALLAALVAGCSAGSGTDEPGADSKPGTPTVAAAAPGKYRTLPGPCRAVPRSTLADLLPGTAALPADQQEKVYEGTAAITYDTDRKVACHWKSESPDASRNLTVDFERVVSYDPAVSDDDRAREVYLQKENAADLPPANPAGKQTSSASVSPSPSSTGTGGTSGKELQPRVLDDLDDLADSAFLDDALTRSGSTAQQRTVSVVFRTSNVIVTVQYAAQPALVTAVPDSEELQEKAQALARSLARTLNE